MSIRRESAKRGPFRVERSEEWWRGELESPEQARVFAARRLAAPPSSNDERVRPGMVRDWCSQQNVHE